MGVSKNWGTSKSSIINNPLFLVQHPYISILHIWVAGFPFGISGPLVNHSLRGTLDLFICARVDQLPLFSYNRGWETQPNSRGLYTHEIRIPIKGGMSLSPRTKEFRPWHICLVMFLNGIRIPWDENHLFYSSQQRAPARRIAR